VPANVATVSDETREFCQQRVPDDCAGDGEVSGAKYCPCSPDDKLPGFSRSQVPSAGHG